jgi:metal-dependent amidase/aminoacylase/carboxypeptidase family protein
MSVVTLGFSEEYTQAQRIQDMQKMAQAMQDIQSGFFYNNVDIVRSGAKDLIAGANHIQKTTEDRDNKDVYEVWMNNNTAMTKRIQRSITSRAKIIVERFSDGDATQALQDYAKISSECMKCHISLRKW